MKYKNVTYFLIVFLLFGCYKKDLEEFKNIHVAIDEHVAAPVFNVNIKLKDSLNFPNFNIYDTLYLVNDGIPLSDSFYLNFKGYDIKEIELKLYIENNFPIEGYLQIYFLDKNNNPIDSLFEIKKLTVPYSSNGYRISEVYLKMNELKYKRMINCNKVQIVYSIKKYNSTLSNYNLFIGCGVKVRIEKVF